LRAPKEDSERVMKEEEGREAWGEGDLIEERDEGRRGGEASQEKTQRNEGSRNALIEKESI